MFDAIVSKTKAMREQMDALRKEAAEQVKPLLSEFIKANPQVKAVKWTQYTPYFNDGDPCTFSIHEPEFYFEGGDLDGDGYSAWCFGHADYRPSYDVCSAATAEACKSVAKALEGIEEALEECFGDHVKVIVTAEGVSVDEYDHD